VAGNLAELARAGAEAVVLAAFGAALVIAAWLLRRRDVPGPPPPAAGVRVLGLLAAALLAGNAVSVAVTGYAEMRYFTPTLAVALLLAWALVTARAGAGGPAPIVASVAALVAAGAFALGTTPASAVLGVAGHDIRLEDPTAGLDAGALAACREPSDVLLLPNETLAYKAGALEGWHIVLVPTNWDELAVADRRDFLDRFRPTVVAPAFGVRAPGDDGDELLEDLSSAGRAVRACGGGAWRLSSVTAPPS
jgi:hypothetical protein